MSKMRPTTGINGVLLPVLPPDRDGRVWAKLVRVMFYTPGFMGLLLLKTGEPASFGLTVELLMLSSAAAVVGGLFVGAQATGSGADTASKIGIWAGSLGMELLSVVPFLCAVPSLFHELAHSALLHARADDAALDLTLGASELLPAVAILPFMIYQLAGFGTLSFVVSKTVNWVLNAGIFLLVVSSYIAYRLGHYYTEKHLAGLLIVIMALTVFYGVLKLKRMQETYDSLLPPPKVKDKKDKDDKED
jgi:hypothetical protein